MATQGAKTQTELLLEAMDELAEKFQKRLQAEERCQMCGQLIGSPFHDDTNKLEKKQ